MSKAAPLLTAVSILVLSPAWSQSPTEDVIEVVGYALSSDVGVDEDDVYKPGNRNRAIDAGERVALSIELQATRTGSAPRLRYPRKTSMWRS
jgi:hypothetical protein